MNNGPTCGRVARAAAFALSAIFVLPSCFTFGLWRTGKFPSGQPFAISIADASQAGGPARLVCKCGPIRALDPERQLHERALARLCAQWQPPLAPGTWLAVEPIEHADNVARLWRELPEHCVLQVVPGENGAAPRAWFVCTPDFYAYHGHLLDDFARWPGVRGIGPIGPTGLAFEAECRVAPTAAPNGVAMRTMTLDPCKPPASTPARLVVTPLTLAIDIAMLPFELITVPFWW